MPGRRFLSRLWTWFTDDPMDLDKEPSSYSGESSGYLSIEPVKKWITLPDGTEAYGPFYYPQTSKYVWFDRAGNPVANQYTSEKNHNA